jgi:hypothetical protein
MFYRYGPIDVADIRSGWTLNPPFCTSVVSAMYYIRQAQARTTRGLITAAMPQVQVRFEQSDLTNFTPLSGPILAASVRASYERSVSRAAARSTTTTSISSTSSSAPAQQYSSTPPRTTTDFNTHVFATTTTSTDAIAHPAHGLSSGADAGIGLGIACAFLLGIILTFLLLRRRRNQVDSIQRNPSKRPWLDDKAELDAEGKHASRTPYELCLTDLHEAEGDLPRGIEETMRS